MRELQTARMQALDGKLKNLTWKGLRRYRPFTWDREKTELC